MFAKIFESIYDGTLADHWQAMVTFQQMLILSDAEGVVDMTPAAITRRTGIPVEIVRAGIDILEQPDPQSRSPAMEGRRIARLDDGRDWGWFIVNHAEYRRRISAEEKRAADRTRIAGKRSAGRVVSDDVADRREQSQKVAKVAHTDTEADTEAEKQDQTLFAPPENPAPQMAAFTLPLNTGEEFPITAGQVREFADLYPAVNVIQALRAMRGWCVTNPTKRKTRAGIMRFVNRWLAKLQDSGDGGSKNANCGTSGNLSAAERVAQANADAEADDDIIDV